MDFQPHCKENSNNEQKKISVIVPIYNVEGLLNRCVESIVSQSYREIEIILVDDGSTDKSLQLCEEWQSKDSRIIVIHKENGGLSDARNAGLSASTGDFVSFVDPDDYVEPVFLETLWTKMVSSGAEIVECAVSKKFLDGGIKLLYVKEMVRSRQDATAHLLKNDGQVYSFAWNKLYRKSVISEIRFDKNLRQSEDTPFVFEVIQNCKCYCQTDAPLYHYIIRKGSLTGGGFSISKMADITAARNILKMCQDQFPQYLVLAKSNVSMRGYSLLRQLLTTSRWDETYSEAYNNIRAAMAESSLKEIRKVHGLYRSMILWLSERMPYVYAFFRRIKSYLHYRHSHK